MATTQPSSMQRTPYRPGDVIVKLASTIRRNVATGVKNVQFGQMQSVLNRLNDDQLAQFGLRRSDIPAYARQMIYGDD